MKLNAKIKFLLFAVFPIVGGIFFASYLFENFPNQKIPNNIIALNESLEASPLTSAEEVKTEKQTYFYVNKDLDQKINLSSKSYIVGDLNTGEIILSKNAETRLPIASVSKLMTALVADELTKEGDVAKVSSKALSTYGQNGNLSKGEQVKAKDLIYPLLLQSSNDSAEVLAEFWGRESFIKKMNQQAEILKMINTSYEDPSGLSVNNQSTVSDLFKLTGYLNQNKKNILNITKQRSYATKRHNWFSTNQFLHKPEYLGGKSGYTNPAKETVISVFDLPLGKETTRPIGIVLLGSNDRVKDVNTILRYLNNNVYYGGEKDATADWIKEKLNVPSIRDPDFITFSFLGDIMLDRGVRSSVNKNFNGDYSSLFEKMTVLKKSDIVFANLEGPASDQGKDLRNLYSFRMDPSTIPALKGAGFNILSVANNHAGDWGREAFIDTLNRLDENEIRYTGGGVKKDAESPTIIEKYGMKIGFLGFSDVGPQSLVAKEDTIGILLANNPRYEEIIRNAKSQVDYLVVSIHWGDEYKTTNNKRQETLAKKAVDAGAKLVIGHHPHVTQNTEVYKDSLIVYSLGNFIFDQKFSVATMQGMLLELKLWRDGSIYYKKNTVKLNKVFQPDQIIQGKEEKLKVQ
jgi:poly-gamma-glutamate synthesis protein (capsule biosynthesis protein)